MTRGNIGGQSAGKAQGEEFAIENNESGGQTIHGATWRLTASWKFEKEDAENTAGMPGQMVSKVSMHRV